ncbi:MAG: CopG family antitoxin [Bacillota bacterium]
MTKKELPEFKTIDEMAEFWDNHDSSDFEEGEIEEIEYKPKRVVLTVRFDAGDMLAISREARRLGMDRSTLVRMAVKQFLGKRHSSRG